MTKISKYNPEIINEYLEKRESNSIPNDVQIVIDQLSWAMEVYDKDRNITRAAQKLKQRIQASQGIKIDISTAKSRIYSAITYFDVDQNISKSIWLRDAANKLEDIAAYSLKLKKPEAALKAKIKALECRIEATDIESNDSLGVVYLLSDNLTPESLGFQSKNKKEIARKAAEGYYIDLINKLDIPPEQKTELLSDCDIYE